MDVIKSPEQSNHVGQTGKNDHEVKNLVATSKNIKGMWRPLFRNLSSMRTLTCADGNAYPCSVDGSSYKIETSH